MFPKILFLCLSAVWISGLGAADLKVEEIIEITKPEDGKFSAPQISPDGTFIIFSGAQYKGLFKYDLNSGQLTELSSAAGAGYEFTFSSDGNQLYFRTHQYKGVRRFFSMYRLNLNDTTVEKIESDVRALSTPLKSPSGRVFYQKQDKLNSMLSDVSQAQSVDNTAEKVVMIRDRKIVLRTGGQEKLLEPLGKGIYIWPSLSPDGDRLLFTKAGQGTFISDLDGNILQELGYANAPVWSADGKWVACMKDYDDGHEFIESEIYATSSNDGRSVRITNTEDIIEMYPSWSSDNKMIVFTSVKGQIYLARLQETQ